MKIFISYSHSDVGHDIDKLDILSNELSKAIGRKGEIFYDRRHGNSDIGSDINKFMSLVSVCDIIILILTPDYKEKIESKRNSGVYREFKYIYDRYMEYNETDEYDKKFVLMPLILSGTFQKSCPNEIMHLKCEDLSWFYLTEKDSTYSMRRDVEAKLNALIKKIVDKSVSISKIRNIEYKSKRDANLRSFLFDNSRSEWNTEKGMEYFDKVFVKTKSFLRIKNGSSFIVVGRKGDGKSTIAHVIPHKYDPLPKINVNIEFDDLALTFCMNILYESPGFRSDVYNILGPIKSFRMIWDLFIYMHIMLSRSYLFPSKSEINIFLENLLGEEVLYDYRNSLRRSTINRILLPICFEKLNLYINHLVGKEKNLLSHVVIELTSPKFRKFVFGENLINHINDIISELHEGDARMLVTVDGFDTESGIYSMDHEYSEFERNILLSICSIAANPSRFLNDKISDKTDFCLVIPYDRYISIMSADRDSHRLRSRTTTISWSGIELSILIRKRLAVFAQVEDVSTYAGKLLSMKERLDKVMEDGFDNIPNTIRFHFLDAYYNMPLFIYILRHTFWRPRDILYYYASILAASQVGGGDNEISDEFIRIQVSMITSDIVRDEFINEFIAVFKNIKEVLSRFRGGTQICDWENIRSKINSIAFDLSIDRKVESLEQKVKFLFDIGFLGVHIKRDDPLYSKCHKHSFVFNERIIMENHLSFDDYKEYEFIIHPIFCEYLKLDTSGNKELVLDMDWRYLQENEKKNIAR